MTEGWTCPRCQLVYAPKTAECRACNDALMISRMYSSLPSNDKPEERATLKLKHYSTKLPNFYSARIPFQGKVT